MRIILLAILIPAVLCGCGQSSSFERHYEEVVIAAPAPTAPFMGEDPHAGLGLDIPITKQTINLDHDLVWTVPSGWREESGSGMRVATFKLADNPDAIDVSIVSLGGMAGGTQANLSRWAKQIELDVTPDDLVKFIADAPLLKTQNGTDATIFDFTKLQEGQTPSEKSTIAAMIVVNEATVFVKMTGTIETVTANKSAFEALTRSVGKK